ncbi:MAG: hydrogen peroxide-inducible genes activator [Pseudomonadales bacterium]|nr:hydrogen peroxide-inducible genes activator [Pseudomonadales bacterium]
MSNRLPTIRQLQYLVALTRLQHFGKAAEACHVSQPAFSIAIRELESCLDSQLVDRDNKHVVITKVGRAVSEQAQRILNDIQELQQIAGFSKGNMQGRLSLGVIPTIAPFLLPTVLPGLRESYPALELILYEGMTEELYRQLLVGSLDFLLLALPYDLKGVEFLTLFRDPFHLAYRENTMILQEDHYDLEKLPDESIFLLQDGHCLRGHSLSACRISNQAKLSPVSASSLLTLVQMVDADLGISFLPEMAVNSSLLTNTKVKTRALSDDSYRDIGLVWRKGSSRENDFRIFGDFLCHNRQMENTGE